MNQLMITFRFEMRGLLMNWDMSRWLLFPSFTCRHILSDKTGTITENNLRVVALATPLHEFSLGNLQSTNAIEPSTDPCLSMLLLNMLTNHSALSIKNTVSSDLTEFMNSISHAQSQSLLIHSPNPLHSQNSVLLVLQRIHPMIGSNLRKKIFKCSVHLKMNE